MLGISPGTRTMGLAVLRHGELIEWRIKTYKGVWSKEKLAYILRAIEKMCDYYQVTSVAIKKVDPRRASPQLEVLTEHLIAFAKEKQFSIATYSLPELMEATGRQQRNLHYAIEESMLERYPIVRKEYQKERNNKRRYYAKMFEAVLCAYMQYMKEMTVR